MSPRARVEALIAIARRIADPNDPLGVEARSRLGSTSRLSPRGIELALTEHLETSPTNEELDALVACTEPAPRCHVILSANVCTAALRALALAVATSADVLVRPSRRDPVLAELLVREVSNLPYFQGSIALVQAVEPQVGEELHAYGSDEVLAEIRSRQAEGVRVRAHGTGLGVAVWNDRGDAAKVAEAIARDVTVFDQAGCLSPRFVLVDGSPELARDAASALHDALSRAHEETPRGDLTLDDRGALTRYREAMLAIDEVLEGAGHLIAVDASPRALLLPPPLRVLLVTRVSPAEVARLVPLRFVTTIGAARSLSSELTRALDRLAPSARRAELGHMQRPPFDGPVDRRSLTRPAVIPED